MAPPSSDAFAFDAAEAAREVALYRLFRSLAGAGDLGFDEPPPSRRRPPQPQQQRRPRSARGSSCSPTAPGLGRLGCEKFISLVIEALQVDATSEVVQIAGRPAPRTVTVPEVRQAFLRACAEGETSVDFFGFRTALAQLAERLRLRSRFSAEEELLHLETALLRQRAGVALVDFAGARCHEVHARLAHGASSVGRCKYGGGRSAAAARGPGDVNASCEWCQNLRQRRPCSARAGGRDAGQRCGAGVSACGGWRPSTRAGPSEASLCLRVLAPASAR
eukprot:TRINITY_DN5461_c0_g1_i1.p1 TRINITY_DN5461_c0_g1~~TRINITY_DN5461_c0_g1_i1.p1  ORF type:complete len:318 (-),score=65.84 TRINITY_DN5461_c0_g1_i1:172-1002(-)